MSVLDWGLATAPLAVVDVETTGLNPGIDRVVEIAVIRLDPQVHRPQLALDSLVNPRRPVALREVHGIEQKDLEDAPTFETVAAMIVEALAGAVLVAHNADFEMRFLRFEFERLGIPFDIPHICTMQLRPLLGLGKRASLEECCRQHGIQFTPDAHVASADAMACAFIALRFRHEMVTKGLGTFASLRELAGASEAPGVGPGRRWLDSFEGKPVQAAVAANLPVSGRTKSRADSMTVAAFGTGSHVSVRREDYLSALMAAVADYELTPEEIAYLARIREESGLTEDQLRSAHAKVYLWVLSMFVADDIVHEGERERLVYLHRCLHQLGWAPGD